jgi:hypothetical protein
MIRLRPFETIRMSAKISLPSLLILLILLSGCRKENECVSLSDEYFPNSIGNRWVYDRFDSLNLEKSTLTVEIVRDSVYTDGKSYRMWVFGKTNMYDTLYVRTTPDSVLFFRYLEGFPQEVMLLPLKTGLSWTHPYFVRDSTWVIAMDTLVRQDDVYPNAYAIQRRLFAFNDYLTDTRWFVPNLGIVRLENWHYLFGWISKENWYLKEYSIR